MEEPEPPPEAALIERARLGPPKKSLRRVSELAGISEGRWRQIVKGYQSASGVFIPVKAPAERLARMALAVGVTGAQLETAGRGDAAQALRNMAAHPSTAANTSGYFGDPAEWHHAARSAQLLLDRALGTDSPAEAMSALFGARALINEAIHSTGGKGQDAQAPKSQQGTRGSASGGEGGPGTPIAGPPESAGEYPDRPPIPGSRSGDSSRKAQ